MNAVNDSVLLMFVGMLNFFGAILLARGRAKAEEIQLPSLPIVTTRPQGEIANA